MSRVFLDHHSRMGDQFIMNGAIREYCKRYDRVGIFSIPKYHPTVAFMFRDLKNLDIIVAPTEGARRAFKLKNLFTRTYDKVVYARGEDLETGILPELQFYKMMDVDHAKKWDSFFVQRDPERERILYEKVNPTKPYVFVHADTRYPIDESKIPSDAMRVYTDEKLTDNIFDYASLIENAEQIHALDSSFMFFIDLLAYTNPTQKLFVHRYARTNPTFNLPILRKPWTILL